jgi:hypothetical protein
MAKFQDKLEANINETSARFSPQFVHARNDVGFNIKARLRTQEAQNARVKRTYRSGGYTGRVLQKTDVRKPKGNDVRELIHRGCVQP